MIPRWTRAATGLTLGALVASSCARGAGDRAIGDTLASSADVIRGERRAPALPTDVGALAQLLGVPRDSLVAAAMERYGRQAYDTSRAAFDVAARLAEVAHDSSALASALMWSGLASWHLTDYTTARRDQERALRIKQAIGQDAELSRSFNGLGLLSWNEGRHREALVQFDSALASARRHADSAAVARASANIPLVLLELGRFDEARVGFRDAAKAAHAVGSITVEGNALANLAALEIRLGHARLAIDLLRQARVLYQQDENAVSIANAYGQSASAWAELGEYQRAIVAADSGIALARKHGLRQEVAATLEVLADVHITAGDALHALQRLREADSIDAVVGLPLERGNNLRRQSVILDALGDHAGAVARADSARVMHLANDAAAEVVSDQLQLASALSAAGDAPKARATAAEALRAAIRAKNQSAQRDATIISARLALNAKDAGAALRLLDDVTTPNVDDDWRLSDLRAEVLQVMGRLNDARIAAQRAVAAVERERASIGIGPLRSRLLASRVSPYARLVSIEIARGDTVSAWQSAASVPGRSLGEQMGVMSSDDRETDGVAEGEVLLRRVSALESSIAEVSADGEERRSALSRSLADARAAYESYLVTHAPTDRERVLGVGRVTLASVQQRLAPDAALVTYLSSPDRLDAFIVRRDRVVYQRVPISAMDLAARVRLARQRVLRPAARRDAADGALGELHHALFGDARFVRAMTGASYLTIVPHGALAALPFAALYNRANGRFLAQELSLAYAPAVSAFAQSDDAILALGDRITAYAPRPDSLPGSIREARAVGRLFQNADLRTGTQATEGDVRARLSEARVVHLATHGVSNAQNPMFSRVELRVGAGMTSRDDGKLEVHEILRLRAQSPLVFLSGCETGLGAGELDAFRAMSDDASLAQAFLVAGVRNVVATLWRVGDARASQIAEQFYQELKRGLRPADALAAMQRQQIAASSDMTWAAYTVMSR